MYLTGRAFPTRTVIGPAVDGTLKMALEWQPGAESDTAVQRAERAGMNVIAGGDCALVVQGHHQS